MAKEDLIPQKMVRVTLPTHASLVRVAAAIQSRTGKNTSMDEAIRVLCEGWGELERIANSDDLPIITSENILDRGRVVTGFLEQYFMKPENKTE